MKKLTLNRRTVEYLSNDSLKEVAGGTHVGQQTRAFTGCDYCETETGFSSDFTCSWPCPT